MHGHTNTNAQEHAFPQVVVVEASAGSGKTYTLARRYLQLLINPSIHPDAVPLDTILAITFTNKAALEMKERILEFLKKIALDTFSSPREKESLLSAFAVDEPAARAKSLRIIEAILRNYNFFQVQTIDSFINAIVSSCAFKLDLSARFKTERDFHEYLAYSLDVLIEQAGRDKDVYRLFGAFLHQYLLIDNKSGWFPKQNLLAGICGLYEKGTRFSVPFVQLPEAGDELVKLRQHIFTLLKELGDSLPEGTNARFVSSLTSFIGEHSQGFAVEHLPKTLKNEAFPLNKGYELPAAAGRLWERARAGVRELCELESASAYHSYIAIFNDVLGYVRRVVHEKDVLFLEALNKEAHRLFDDESFSLPELYYRLAVRFRHFLIDEFQDTSRLQWENLDAMVGDALSSGGSLFYVGDRKQAIYRFRGGEVALFNAVKEAWADFNLITHSLSRNFRSSPEIVEFVNEIFSRENLQRFLAQKQEESAGAADLSPEDALQILDVFKDSRQSCVQEKSRGYVKVEFLDQPSGDERAAALKQKLISLIGSLTNRYRPADIAVLTRSNAEVGELSSWLLEAGIPVESERTLNIRSNPRIKEIISFLIFLNSPIDNLAFASFISGEIFCAACGVPQDQIRDFLFAARESEESGYVYRAFSKRFPQVWETCIEGFFKSVGFVPLYELTVSIFHTFEVMKRFPGHQGFFMRFLELIRESEEKYPGLSSFLGYFEHAPVDDLSVAASEGNAVKILTVHKAKGLEFPVVVVPSLEMVAKVDEEAIVEDGSGLKLLRLKKPYTLFSGFLARVYRSYYVKAFIDELNNMYVALTRAGSELYLFIPSKAQNRINQARLLVGDTVAAERGEAAAKPGRSADAAGRGSGEAVVDIPASEYRDWRDLLKDEFGDERMLRERSHIRRGDWLHLIFSAIGVVRDGDVKGTVAAALELVRHKFPPDADVQACAAVVEEALGKPEVRTYFEPGTGTVYAEKEIVDSYGNTRRIDRMLVGAQEVVVIDFKSGRGERDKHHEQVREYMSLAGELYPRHTVKGVLFYVDTGKVETINR